MKGQKIIDMKALLYISSLLIFVGCNSPISNPSLYTNIAIRWRDEIYKYVLVDTTGYYAARDFKGIGNFKVGETTISIIKKSEVRKVNDSSDEYWWIGGSEVLQLFPNPTNVINNPSKVSYCPEVKIFKVKSITISSIPLEDVYLTFYRDTLIELKCNENEKIATAMEYKYGKGTKIIENIGIKCGYGYSNGTVRILLWQNKKIKAEIHKGHVFCMEDQFDYYFRINSKSTNYNSIISCDTINKRRFTNKIKEEEKSKLKNF
jgi:hypothetical protein